MIAPLIAALRHLRLEPTAEDVADIVWLAQYLPTAERSPELPAEVHAARPSSTLRDEQLPPSLLPPPSTEAHAAAHPKRGGRGVASQNALGALPFSIPTVPALPARANLRRALRPFMRRVPSHTQRVLDEEATVQWMADLGGKRSMPIVRPAHTRWLDVALVVESWSSMVLWHQTIAELKRLLEQQGAFRQIQTWSLSTDIAPGSLRLHKGREWGPLHRQVRDPHEIVDPSGRRLVMVVSDCVSPAWRRGEMTQMLSIWARHNTVVLVQMLPQRLWSRSALGSAISISLRARLPGMPNARLEKKSLWGEPDTSLPAGCPVPVVTLEAYTIIPWAEAIAGRGSGWMSGVILTIAPQDRRAAVIPSSASITPEERVRLFHSVASPVAWRLAGYLAAVPLTLPIMNLVQQVMLPGSYQGHLAEVFLSGLLKRLSSSETLNQPDHVAYDFIDGVRDILLSTVRISETIGVLTAVSRFLERHLAHPLNFSALLADPSATGDLIIEPDSRPFAVVAVHVLQRLGGEYARLAAYLRQALDSAPLSLEPGQVPTQTLEEREQDVDEPDHTPAPVTPRIRKKAKILGIVMAGGAGTRLQPLTRDRAKPAVPFGGKYRIIDFVLSNFINSEIYAIHVLVQFKSQSLIEHLQAGWRFGRFPMDQYFISTIPAQMRTGQTWYQGTADAVYQNIHLIKQFKPDFLAVFGADHIYRLDIRQMVAFHFERDAEVTIAAFPVTVAEGSAFDILQTDRQGYVTGLQEKPAQPQGMPNDPDYCLASMGNYLFSTPVLIDVLEQNARDATSHDFGHDIIPQLIGDRPVYAYDFRRNRLAGEPEDQPIYWRDVGTLDAYYEANMELLPVRSILNLYNPNWPIWTATSFFRLQGLCLTRMAGVATPLTRSSQKAPSSVALPWRNLCSAVVCSCIVTV